LAGTVFARHGYSVAGRPPYAPATVNVFTVAGV
jgi:hypothetical protein